MRKIIYSISLLLMNMCLGGCEQNTSYTQTLLQIDSLMKANETDNAYNLLEKVYDGCTSGGSNNEKMRANYLMGWVYSVKGEAPQAMSYYLKASDYGDTARDDCDLRLLSRIHAQMAYLYMQEEAPRNALVEMDITDRIARKSGEILMIINNLEQKANAYRALDMTDSSLIIRQEVSELYTKHGYDQQSARALGPAIGFLLKKGDYALAKNYMDRYEAHSGLFDEDGQIQEGLENYYALKSNYYLQTGRLDSAEHFARRSLQTDEPNNIEEGYMALLKLYQTKGQKDSIAKYSLLAYEINQVIYQEMNSETLQRMQALYNYSRSQQTAEENKHKADTLRFWLIFAGTTVVLLTLLILWALNHYKNEQKAIKKQFADIQQEKSDLEELMSKNDSQHSTEIEEKEMTIKAMDAELQKYKKNKLYINIAAATAAINAAAIMKTFKKKAKGEGGAPSFDEWNELSQLVNEHLPHFIPALQERYPAISPAETEICLLVRLHFSNAQIATLLNRTESAVSKSKERLLEKIFPGTIGGAREFAQKLQVLG